MCAQLFQNMNGSFLSSMSAKYRTPFNLHPGKENGVSPRRCVVSGIAKYL